MGLFTAAIGIPTQPGNGNGSSSLGSGPTTLSLGRLTDVVTAAVVVGSIGIAILAHVHAFGWVADPLIDLFATISFGAVIGRASGIGSALAASSVNLSTAQAAALQTVNSNTAELVKRADLNTTIALRAHDRLDAIAAAQPGAGAPANAAAAAAERSRT